MALADVRLSLLAFPQRWRPGVIDARVLLLPTGDPTTAPGFGLPAFAGTDWALRATLLPGPDSLLGPVPGSPARQQRSVIAAAPPGAAALFEALRVEFAPSVPAPLAQRRARVNGAAIRKELPESYRRAFAFERAAPGTTTGNEFGCALRETVPALPGDPKPADPLTWGAVLSFALRQPLLARALGLLHDFSFALQPDDALADGGWLYLELDPAGPTPPPGGDLVRSYAARLPALQPADDERALFAAVLLPVGLTSGSDYDAALAEAALYDDGFAKIVHAEQARSADATSSGHHELRPATDAGVDLGWDDEQVTRWLNRQLQAMQRRLDPAAPPAAEAPLGVAGYRVDVRDPGDGLPGAWESLCRAFSIDGEGQTAPLRFPPQQGLFEAQFDDELAVEPTPLRSRHASTLATWLPRHFARWQDGSLVVNDDTLFRLAGATPRDADGQPLAVPPPLYGARLPQLRLRYGRAYEFRCRCVDLTGGGPQAGDTAVNPAPHPVAPLRFLRHLSPKSLRLESDVARPAPGEATPAVAAVQAVSLFRPLIGYPEMVFAGVDDPGTIAQLLAGADAARAAGTAVGVLDPDVDRVRVVVQVRLPAHDPGPEGAPRDGDWTELYRSEIALPPLDPAEPFGPGAPLQLALDYLDVPDLAAFAAPAPGAAVLPLPRARDLRLRFTPLCQERPDYYGSAEAREGLTVDLATRADAQAEDTLFVASADEAALNALWLQPGSDLLQRIADQLGLAADGLTLSARPGERVVFGASAALRHTLAPDAGAITFASSADLLGHWLAALQLELARDWTWDGLDEAGILVQRADAAAEALREVGRLRPPFSVTALALQGAGTPGVDRRARTRCVFLDAVDAQPPAGAFPQTPTPRWVLTPQLRALPPAAGDAQARTLAARLPVAVAPRQTPRLVAAGVALTPYAHDAAYASSAPRRKVLWFELDAPVADPNDALFARVLAYGPDPLLSGAITHQLLPVPDLPAGPASAFDLAAARLPTPPQPPALAVDPEPLRVIVPGQPEDSSGLAAMLPMEPAVAAPGGAGRHFIVPLPPGVEPDAPELFGFWTYELRIGHRDIWSTAQARFGAPLVVKGVQHPPPALRCSAQRVKTVPATPNAPARIVVAAPLAAAVFEDRRLVQPGAGDPRTRLWVLLYAQVVQADGASRRNLLIARALAQPRFEHDVAGALAAPARELVAVAQFDEAAVLQRLADLGLPAQTPLSVIAVELLPGDHLLQHTIPLGATALYVTTDLPDGVPDQPGGDPLGRELGSLASRRILRTSVLTPVAAAC